MALASQKTERSNFGTSKIQAEYPDFLEVQIKSFQDFFQLENTENQAGKGDDPPEKSPIQRQETFHDMHRMTSIYFVL